MLFSPELSLGSVFSTTLNMFLMCFYFSLASRRSCPLPPEEKLRTLSTPVLILDMPLSMITIGYTPITTFPEEQLIEGLLYLLGYYYTLRLTYPKCVATLLSVLQTEIFQDNIHKRDTTHTRAMAEWKASVTGK